MKRHDSLQPFSREHHHGLVLARLLREVEDQDARRSVRVRLAQQWASQLVPHFAHEERWLTPLLTREEEARLTQEHDTLRELASLVITSDPETVPNVESFRQLGTLLHDHIRWEERELFEALQIRAADALDKLLEPLLEIEARRPPVCWT